jgi:hypothetical protein
MDITSEHRTSDTALYQETFLKYVENEYCAEYRCVPVYLLESLPSSNPIPCFRACGSCQSSGDPYALSNNDEEYLMPNNVAEMTPS